MICLRRILGCVVTLLAIVMILGVASAADKQITVGYQLVYNPWKVAIASGEFEKGCKAVEYSFGKERITSPCPEPWPDRSWS